MEARHSMPLWKKRLLNSARRGNAEVEMMLVPYIHSLLTLPEPHSFERLLNENDQQLMEWFMQPNSAPNNYLSLIQDIRTYYLTHSAK